MNGKQLIAVGAVIWFTSLLIPVWMIWRPISEQEYRRVIKRDSPSFFLDLFGIDRSNQNYARLIRIAGIAGVSMWLALTIAAILFADWAGIAKMAQGN